jgi:RNA polymerase sigma factor (sigma-70 family)
VSDDAPRAAPPAARDAAGARDTGRVARLFAAHHASLYRYLVHLTGDADRAADAAQEAFVRLITRGPASDGPASDAPAHRASDAPALPAPATADDDADRAWLFRVATRAALDEARTGARRRRLLGAAPGRAPVADPAPDAHDAVEARERRAHVAGALATLAERDRAALLLRESGFAHREIAEALGTTTGAVGTVLARALPRLAAALRARVPGGPAAL